MAISQSLDQKIGKAVALAAILMLIPALAMAQPYSADFSQSNDFVTPEGSPDCTADVDNPVVNCSFETGDFTGWGVEDLSVPFLPLGVFPGGGSVGFGFFLSAPTQGTLSAVTGFDGDGASGATSTISLFQDLTLPDGLVTLEFDYRGAWDLTFGATIDRTFTVNVEPSGGGVPMQTDLLLTAVAGETVLDTGSTSAVIDLSDFAGDDVRISLDWFVPEDNTGPGQVEVDNVLITAIPIENPTEIPTLSQVGLLVMVLLLSAASFIAMRRRRRGSDRV